VMKRRSAKGFRRQVDGPRSGIRLEGFWLCEATTAPECPLSDGSHCASLIARREAASPERAGRRTPAKALPAPVRLQTVRAGMEERVWGHSEGAGIRGISWGAFLWGWCVRLHPLPTSPIKGEVQIEARAECSANNQPSSSPLIREG